MLWKTNFIEESKLNASADSMPGDAEVNCINNENDDEPDDADIKYCDDNSIVLNARRSVNYDLSDIESKD